jgi:simple sugar transport system ATP-binding protein
LVGSISRAEATERRLVELIIGEAPADPPTTLRVVPNPEIPALIELRDVAAIDDRGRGALRGVNLVLRPGEIVGVAGVSGNGQRELGEVIQGVRPIQAGSILIDSTAADGWSVAQRRMAGVLCIPEDPLAFGAVPAMTVEENLALGDRQAAKQPSWQPIDWMRARARSSWITEQFQLAMPRLHAAIEQLSGGNVQRVVCARELSGQPRLLLAYYPTRGMDIHAAAIIRKALIAARDAGAAVLVVSEDLDELIELSDRLVVMYHGQIAGEFLPEQADVHAIGFLMTGGRQAA